MVLQTEHPEQLDMQGTFLLLHLLTRVAFKLDASYSFCDAPKPRGPLTTR